MLETVKKYIAELPDNDFNDYYQRYIFQIQDDNLSNERGVSDSTFNSINKLLNKIRKEIGM